MTRTCAFAAALLACTAVTPAFAQTDAYDGTVFDGDYLTVGIGGAYGPSYEGSDDYTFFPLPAIQGSFGGVDINPRPGGVAFDVIPQSDGSRFDFVLGPVARVRFDRNSRIKDPVVALLGKRDVAIEVGATGGIQYQQLLNPYDSITATVDVRWDVANAHDGMVIAPSLSYLTPVSRGAAVLLSVSAEHVDNDYADYYFTVTPAGSVATGGALPTYTAGKGWKNVGALLFGTVDLDGDLTNGGFALFAAGSYSRLLEDAKRSPVTSIRGDADQWTGGVGIGYTF